MTASHIKAKRKSAAPSRARRERETVERREAILAAARELFFRQGIRRTTVDDIAAQAQIAKGTVYLYFESKETILAHLLLEGLNRLVSQLEAAFAAKRPLSAEARLRRLAAAYFQFAQEEQEYFRLMMAFDRSHFQQAVTPDVYQQILLRSMRGLRWVVRALEQGIEAGEFSLSDARSSAGMFWAALNGVLILISHPLRRELLEPEVETLYNGVLELTLKGMKR